MYRMSLCDPPLLVASGRTTRLVDYYVQQLFNNPGAWVDIEDHAEWGVGRRATDLLMERIYRRMLAEHNIRLERKMNDHYFRIPYDSAIRLKQFRTQQEQAQKMWHESLKI